MAWLAVAARRAWIALRSDGLDPHRAARLQAVLDFEAACPLLQLHEAALTESLKADLADPQEAGLRLSA